MRKTTTSLASQQVETCLTVRLSEKSMTADDILNSLQKARAGESKLDETTANLIGGGPPVYRHLLNNLCNFEGCRYLEVGCYQGASLISAAYKNPGVYYGIDNFSEKNFPGNCRARLDANLGKYPDLNIEFHEEDSWQIDTSQFRDINVYFYDGDHGKDGQRDGILRFWNCLARRFLLIVDDYSWENSILGTQEAFDQLDFKTEFRLEIHDSDNKLGWWNGYLLLLGYKKAKML